MIIDKLLESKIIVYAFVGPSGTGKSYRAQMVANENNIRYIIDDGLLIKDNEVIAGESAKKAPTKVETVKEALFSNPVKAEEIKRAFRKYKPESLLILGTSDNMVSRIRENLELPEISKTIYITDVATEQEVEEARRMRVDEGKHVIPVPTFEIKKDFSGYLLDPLQIFKSKGKDKTPYISEKSIIRPTFSYLGNYTISDGVLKDIIVHLATKTEAILRIRRTRINKTQQGVNISIEVVVLYGVNIVESLISFKKNCIREIENLTAMNVDMVEILARDIEKIEEKK